MQILGRKMSMILSAIIVTRPMYVCSGGLSYSPIKNTTTFMMLYANIKYKPIDNKWIYPAVKGGVRYNLDQSTLAALRFSYSLYRDEPSNLSLDFHKKLR